MPNPSESTRAVVEAAARSRLNPRVGWIGWFNEHWFLLFNVFYGLLVGLPFLAPVFMKIGWEGGARAIYFFYTFLCHQLPQRSFFMFGPQTMYDLPTIQAAWENTINPLVLRQFIGNAEMGWKVAWSDRMVSMYTSILIEGWIWYPFRKRVKSLPLWAFALFALPMFVDGSTHFLSDLSGIGQGFRDSNLWLANLTDNVFPPTFYAGDALGSFNSWMRLITGTLFGIGAAWVVFPMIEETSAGYRKMIALKLRQAGLTSGSGVQGEHREREMPL